MDCWTQFVSENGPLILFGIALGDQIGLPLPTELLFIQAGAMVATGKLGLVETLVPTILGSALANVFLHATGRRYGLRLMEAVTKFSLEPGSVGSETKRRFGRWGLKFLLVSQFFPLAWTLPILSGMTKTSFPRFFAFSITGFIFWAGSFIAVGYVGSSQIDSLLRMATGIVGTVGGVGGLIFTGWIISKLLRRHRILRQHREARISPASLKQIIDVGDSPVILDVRTREALAEFPYILPGAIVIPVEDIDQRRHEIPSDRHLVIYCSCPNELGSARVALQLNKDGLERIHALEGGIDSWRAHGFPIEARITVSAAA